MCDRDSVLLIVLWTAVIMGCMGQMRTALFMLLVYGLVKFIGVITE